jgi:hypothetical protein
MRYNDTGGEMLIISKMIFQVQNAECFVRPEQAIVFLSYLGKQIHCMWRYSWSIL